MPTTRLGVLLSGRGSNLAALLDAIDRGDLAAQIAVVVSNNSRAGGLELARAANVPALHISSKTHVDSGASLLEALQAHDVHVLVLAGYMKKVDPRIVRAFEGRAVNIHPAPLPRFGGPGMYGEHVHRAVLEAGVPHSGPTVHLLSLEYDEGPVLAHRSVPVEPGDTVATLAARVLEAEHDLYWRVIDEHFCRAQKPHPPR
jgi:phosphoribosylglycinamide formyltransferase 1